MARSAKKRPASEPNESDVEDDEPAEAQSQPDKRKKRKSAQPAANVAEDSDERQQEVEEPSPDLSSSQRRWSPPILHRSSPATHFLVI